MEDEKKQGRDEKRTTTGSKKNHRYRYSWPMVHLWHSSSPHPRLQSSILPVTSPFYLQSDTPHTFAPKILLSLTTTDPQSMDRSIAAAAAWKPSPLLLVWFLVIIYCEVEQDLQTASKQGEGKEPKVWRVEGVREKNAGVYVNDELEESCFKCVRKESLFFSFLLCPSPRAKRRISKHGHNARTSVVSKGNNKE